MSWQRGVRDERYKLIEYCVEGVRHTQLYDLQKDPAEVSDLSSSVEFAPVVKRLRNLLVQDRVRLNDGNTEFPFTDNQGKEFWTTFEKGEPAGKPPLKQERSD